MQLLHNGKATYWLGLSVITCALLAAARVLRLRLLPLFLLLLLKLTLPLPLPLLPDFLDLVLAFVLPDLLDPDPDPALESPEPALLCGSSGSAISCSFVSSSCTRGCALSFRAASRSAAASTGYSSSLSL
jgi:hypothetical protein